MATIIYEPKGRAHEYSELACNLWVGCSHRCSYCYGPKILHMAWDDFIKPRIKDNALERLRADAEGMAGDSRQVQMCFIGDPYMPEERELGITRRAIQILHEYGLKVSILTKGGMSRTHRDLDLLGPGDSYGATLTFSKQLDSTGWEPGASTPMARMAGLMLAKNLGIHTWVSLEPVIYVEQTLELIRETYGYVDEYRCGILNYCYPPEYINWQSYARRLINTLRYYRCAYYIKDDLMKYMPMGTPKKIEKVMAV